LSGSRQFSSNASYKPVNCWIYSSGICVIKTERYFAFFPSFEVQKAWHSLCNIKVLQQHSVGTVIKGYRSTQSSAWQNRTPNFRKQTAGTSGNMSGNEDTCCPLSLGILHYTSRVFCSVQCLGSVYTNMPTSNGVTIYGSKFPPTVSKHCQHQHSAIPNTIQAMWNINKPSCCVIQSAVSL